MFCFSRCILRWGLITGLALGGVTLLVGPERVAAGLSCVRAKAQSVVDSVSDDPMALRRQLVKLGEEYPERIAKVGAEISEVDQQIAEFAEDSEVSERVIAMTTEDMGELNSKLAQARKVTGKPVFIRFEGVRFNPAQARAELEHINQIRINYSDRLSVNRQQLNVLHQQKARLTEIFNKLTDEYSTYQTQMWQLDRQIDAIQRNDRLIEMTEELQATLASYDRWGDVGNLKQLQSKLAHLRDVQQAQLEVLNKANARKNYVDRARSEIEDESTEPVELFDDLEKLPDPEDAESYAFSGPVIID